MKDDLLFAILVTCVFLSACRKDPKPDVFKITEVETTASSTGAEIKGSYIFNSIPNEMKILYGKDDDLSNALASEVDINGDEFKVVIDGLESKTNYHYCFECIASHSSIKTATKSFMTLAGRPTVITNEIFDIGTDAAKGGGIVTDDGGAMVTSRGICWSHNQNPTTDDRHTTDGDGTGEFASEITKLSSNTKYYVRAYAANEAGTAYGEEKCFTTEVGLPTVITSDVSEIMDSTARCGGIVTNDGGSEITARGVCWGTSKFPTLSGPHTNDGTGTGEFTSEMSRMRPNTEYYVRAYATNAAGTIYGDNIKFTTIGLPMVSIVNISDLTRTSATMLAYVTYEGGTEVTARGVCWSVNPNLTTEDHHSSDGGGIGEFSIEMTGLVPNTKYYVRAYATNELGTAYSEEESLITVPEEQEPTGYINGYPYVDLGLPSGLKWAMYNVGASSTTDCGDTYAWGEIETKSSYTPNNCSSYGLAEDISGDARYDAARAKWSSTWRMPTIDEAKELEEYCTLRWVVYNGDEWLMITGPNGNYIFLPARTHYENHSELIATSWTSTPSSWIHYQYTTAYCIYTHNINDIWYGYFDNKEERWRGRNIRPVSD